MPALINPRQERFVKRYLKTGVAADAYRYAGYVASTRNSLDSAASRMLRNVKVKSRIGELRRAMAQKTQVTVETLSADLDRVMRGAEADKQWSAAKGAIDTKAKLHGLLVDRKETGAPGEFAGIQTSDQIVDMIRKELGEDVAKAVTAALEGPSAAEQEPIEPNVEASNTVN